MDILGGVCVRCGFSDDRALAFDHVDGGGRNDPRSSMSVCRAVLKGSTEFQLLCANCNAIKKIENAEHGNRTYVRIEPTARLKKERDWAKHSERMRELHADPEWSARRAAAISSARKKKI